MTRPWAKFLDEKESEREFSSTQINLPKPLAKEIIAWGYENIPDSYLYSEDGRELNPHITVLYGLRDESPNKVKEILEQEKSIKLKLGKISAFETPGYDVIKIEINSPGLHKLHRLLESLPHQDNHPRYNPHVTIAYVKKGKGKRVIGNGIFDGEIVESQKIMFGSKNGEKTIIELK